MTQTIKLELPTDNASVLHHMGTALQSIANESGYVNSTPDPTMKTTKVSTLGKASVSVTTEPVIKSKLETDIETFREVKGDDFIEPLKDEVKLKLDNVTVATDEEVAAHESQLDVSADVTTPPIEETIESVSPPLDVDHNLDKNGIPYDSRIHSRGKTRNADNTWRNARCPKDKTAEEWTAYIAEVEAELKALMDIPVVTTVEPTTNEPKYWRNPAMGSCGEVNGEEELTEFLNKFPNAEPITHEQFVQFQAELEDDDVISAQPVVRPPVVEDVTPPLPTPPVVEVETTVQLKPDVTMEQVAEVATQALGEVVEELNVPKNFGELMKFITTNNKKLTSEAVKQVLADQGLASIALLAPRPDLIPQVHAKLVELL